MLYPPLRCSWNWSGSTFFKKIQCTEKEITKDRLKFKQTSKRKDKKMRYHSSTFFSEKGEGPKVSIRIDDSYYPVTISISESGLPFKDPSVKFFLRSIQDLINFKNSVIQEYDKYLRSKEVKNV